MCDPPGPFRCLLDFDFWKFVPSNRNLGEGVNNLKRQTDSNLHYVYMCGASVVIGGVCKCET